MSCSASILPLILNIELLHYQLYISEDLLTDSVEARVLYDSDCNFVSTRTRIVAVDLSEE